MKYVNPIASVFARSPFKPIQEHMNAVTKAVEYLPALFDALAAGDQTALTEAKEAIFAKEHEADKIKQDVRLHLPRTLFMPVDRRDLLEVLEVQDAIADKAQDIAGLVHQRAMEVPDDMVDDLKALVRRCVDACAQSEAIIEELDELVETGFGGPEADRVEEMVKVLNRIESETDTLAIELTRKLFSHEDTMNPVSVMFWYRLIQWISNVADDAEKVGDRMLLLIAR